MKNKMQIINLKIKLSNFCFSENNFNIFRELFKFCVYLKPHFVLTIIIKDVNSLLPEFKRQNGFIRISSESVGKFLNSGLYPKFTYTLLHSDSQKGDIKY